MVSTQARTSPPKFVTEALHLFNYNAWITHLQPRSTILLQEEDRADIIRAWEDTEEKKKEFQRRKKKLRKNLIRPMSYKEKEAMKNAGGANRALIMQQEEQEEQGLEKPISMEGLKGKNFHRWMGG